MLPLVLLSMVVVVGVWGFDPVEVVLVECEGFPPSLDHFLVVGITRAVQEIQ